jgi:hypothetical protein
MGAAEPRTALESREHRKVVEEFISWRQQSRLKGLVRAIKRFRKFGGQRRPQSGGNKTRGVII